MLGLGKYVNVTIFKLNIYKDNDYVNLIRKHLIEYIEINKKEWKDFKQKVLNIKYDGGGGE